jgi:hypothetical protein
MISQQRSYQMPILRPSVVVAFDVNNPEHVACIFEMEVLNKRTNKINFDFPPSFPNGVAYAKHLMVMAWCHHMAQQHKEVKDVEERAKAVATGTSGSDNVRVLPVIGSKSKPLQENAHRNLPPGSTLG